MSAKNRPSRADAHAKLDALYDALESSEGASDPDEAAAGRRKAFDIWRELFVATGKALVAERLGAARMARSMNEVGAQHSASAIGMGQRPVAALHQIGAATGKVFDREEPQAQRRMIARLALDLQDLLPEGLADNIATTFHLLCLGDTTPLSSPYRVKGLGKTGAQHVLALCLAGKIYYLKGYRRATLSDVLRSLPPEEQMSEAALHAKIQRLKIRAYCEAQESKGIEDYLAQRPEDCGLSSSYDLAQLAEVSRRRGGAAF